MKLIQRFIRYSFNQQNTKIRKSRRQNENVNENVNDKTLMSSKDENENEDKDDKTLMSSNEDDYEIIKTLMHSHEYVETTNQNEKNIIIKKLNDHLDKIIDKSKSFEDQIKSIRKVENLNEYCFINDYGDKELEFKIFKLKLAHLSNIIDKKLFKQIFGHTLEKLANKLINTTSEEENQTIAKNIDKNRDRLYEEDDFRDYVIQPSDRRIDLIEAIKLILNFSKAFSKKLGIANIGDRTQCYSDKFKKMRCEIQECGKYQSCRMFIENTLAFGSRNNNERCKNTISYF